jgi:MYXO-CTERM domain-containing protein
VPSLFVRLRPVVAALATTGALLLVVAPSASAHDALVSTSPASGSTLTSPPTAITLTFEEPPTTQGMAVALTSPDGTVAKLVPTLAGDVVTAPVAGTLAPGGYRVAWRIVADDGHPVTGTFAFTLAASTTASASASAPASAAPVTQVATEGTSSVGPWVVTGVVLLVVVAGAALLARRRRA